MIFTPLEPNAGPIGGEGLAAPPFTCNLINAAISLAIIKSINDLLLLFYLHEAKLQRSFSSKNFNHYFKLLLFIINLLNDSVEAIKWPINNFHSFSHYEGNIHFLSQFSHFIYLTKNPVNFRLTHRNRISTLGI